MKRIILTSILLFIFVSIGFSQQTSWQWVSPLPQGNILNEISVVNQDTLFTCGLSGTFMSSVNGGETWNVDNNMNGAIEEFHATHFLNGSVGWVAGENGRMFKTTNGGVSWKEQSLPTNAFIYSIHFISSTTGWACGEFGTIIKTTDGGSTWVSQVSSTNSLLWTIQFLNSSTGFAVGSGGKVLKTTNSGTSWQITTLPGGRFLYGLSFTSTSIGIITDDRGTIYRTINGGTNWQSVEFIGWTLWSAQFVSSTVAYVAGSFGTILKSTDAGLTWMLFENIDTYKDFFHVRFATTNIGWAVGDYGTIFKTTNGGVTWKHLSTEPKTEMSQTFFASTTVGYSVGEEGACLKTTDGGYHWTRLDLGYYLWMYGLIFLNEQTGWVVGDSGLILKTGNGVNWSKQNSGLEEDMLPLYSIYFTDANHGWACGSTFGIILKTTNGGLVWNHETTDVGSDLQKIKFFNQNIGWAVGGEGTIVKTTDGGDNWTLQESGTSFPLYSLEIIDQNNVFVSGDYGLILHTTDGGTTWQPMQVGDGSVSDLIYDIAFYQGQYGWAVGDYGVMLASTDGGINWNTQPPITINTLFNVQVIPTGITGALIFAAGQGNTILTSALSPLPMRTWKGTIDSLWENERNWFPQGVPTFYDSVYIPLPLTFRGVTLRQPQQRINIASLHIGTGGRLVLGSGLSELIVSNGIIVDGTFHVESNSRTDIITGGGFVINSNGVFNQANSSLTLNAGGTLKGTFSQMSLTESSKVSTSGNVFINKLISINAPLQVRPADTVNITTTDTLAVQGNGIFNGGTVKRAIASGSTSVYRFESPVTTVQFLPGGTTPTHVLLTSYPNTLAPDMPDSVFVKRYYVGKTLGSTNFKARVFLRYSEEETYLSPSDVAFYRDSSGFFLNLGSTDFIDDDYMATGLDSISEFITWYLGDASFYPKHPQEFISNIIISDNGLLSDTLTLGALKAATTGIDPTLGEIQLGTKPPAGTFDARWILPSTLATSIDYRPFTEGTNTQNLYLCEFQPGVGGYPFQLNWNNQSLPSGKLFLRDAATQGSKFNVNMKTQSSLTITDQTVTSFQIVQDIPFYIAVQKDWNIVSLPLTPTTSSLKKYIFPTALSQAFKYNNGYTAEETLKNGIGYWLKFYRSQNIGIEGLTRTFDTITVASGWNMIGSITNPIVPGSVSKDPPIMVIGAFFGYASGYTPTDSLRPGKGYWVKTDRAGKLVLSSSGFAKGEGEYSLPDFNQFSKIIVSDRSEGEQALYLANDSKLSNEFSQFELPPLPPGEVFDARFSSNNLVESLSKQNKITKQRISIQSNNYPVMIRCEGVGSEIQFVTIADAERGTHLGTVMADGKSFVRIDNPSITKIELTVSSGATIPKVFSLEQNYPNPFNPSTTIQFNLPDAVTVSLQIFNVLGQEVATLLNNTLYEPGSYFTTWNGANFGSGMYFYRVTARKQGSGETVFQDVKKLLLVK
ncbi:MAG: T9SS type A sorting domain-containing protein [Ignavibacteriales bacterium]|nr:T9SS type A sorting domain-containing protein [Ignavibacteriales bacterium]